ncbi:MAG: (R)-1-hydroxy-2-aminoethylphosphonate ammonia-lyase [Syntrophales bacterium]
MTIDRKNSSEGRPAAEQGDVNTTEARQKYWERNLAAEARLWFDEDSRYFLHQSLSTPVLNVIARAEGAWLEDLNGKRYLDMHGNGVHNAGFNHPAVVKAVKEQLEAGLSFCPRRYTNIPVVRLAKKLAEIAPGGLCRSLFCPGGSDAVEMALKLARYVTGRFKTISFWDSFHGAGFGAAGVGGEEHFHGGLGPLGPGAFHVEFPNYYRNPWRFTREEDVDAECLRQVELVLRREPEMAAVIGEPVSANPVVPSRRYWEGVKELCEKYGALLIFDEVIEGFGRTGRMFASEHFLTPDILVLGKSLGGGIVPLAGIVTHEKYNCCPDRSVGHYTHEKNALSAAAALAEIAVIEEEDLCGRAANLGAHALERLAAMAGRHRLIGSVTGIGLHIGIDLVRDRQTKERASREAEAIMFRCMERGLAFKTIDGNIITLRPALVITREELDWALDLLDEAIGEVENGAGY